MTPIPTSSAPGGGDKPSIPYPDFNANTPFENFPGFQEGTSYIPYNILNDMNIIIQAANKATKEINDAEKGKWQYKSGMEWRTNTVHKRWLRCFFWLEQHQRQGR
jgi:hypothetical protein